MQLGLFGKLISNALANADRLSPAEQQLEEERQAAAQFTESFVEDRDSFIANGLEWYEEARASRIFRSKMEEADLGNGLYDFSVFDGVDGEVLARLMKYIEILCFNTYKSQGVLVLENENITIEVALTRLYCYSFFDAYHDMILRTIKHRDYYVSNRCLESIFTIRDKQNNPDVYNELSGTDLDRAWLKEFYKKTAIQIIIECDLLNWYPQRSKHRPVIDALAEVAGIDLIPSAEELLDTNEMVSENFVRAMDIIAGADKDVEHFNMLKTALIRISHDDMSDEGTIALYNFIVDASKLLLSALVYWQSEGERRGGVAYPVDLIIAEAYRLDKAGMISNIDELLNEQIELYAHASFDSAEQLVLLASTFDSLGAYKQELAVLECMVSNNLPRTEQLEAILTFLKDGGVETMSSMSTKMKLEYEKEDDKLAIDYRTIAWNEGQITALFDIESGNDSLMTVPIVFDEWNRHVVSSQIKWSTEEVINRVSGCIYENFGNELGAEKKDVAIIMDGDLDYVESIVIKAGSESRYPWLGFVLSGEQMTLKQVSLTLFCLYYPENDYIDEKSVIQRNKKAGKRAVMLKLHQNPRINNFITTVEEIVIDALEKSFNDGSSGNIY